MSHDTADLGRVAVLYGGVTAEREVSMMSGENVLQALLDVGVDAFPIIIDDNPIQQLIAQPIDRAISVLHGKKYEDGQFQGVLNFLNIPYPGAGVAASAITFDKILCKQLWRGADLPTPDMLILTPDTAWEEIKEAVGTPFVIKPSCEGSSLGVHIVRHVGEYAAARDDAWHYGSTVIAEAFIEGSEYTVSFLNNEPLPIIKIQIPNGGMYDYHAKYTSEQTEYLIPSGLSAAQEAQLYDLVTRAFVLCQCRDWGRIDVLHDAKQDHFWLIDANTIPGMTTHSLMPKAASAAGVDLGELLLKLLRSTL